MSHRIKCKRPWMEGKEVGLVFKALQGEARFVGGCVRDAVVGIDAKDIDIATPYMPEITMAMLQGEGIKVVPTGIKHGTVTAVINHKTFEITTLRRDIECYGRHAKVEFTDDWEEDAARRDFTMNAMSCTQNGELYDYFGGLSDLRSGFVKFVGDAEARCKEDILRILRFFRFNAYYGHGLMDKEGLNAAAKLAPLISELSGERVQTEMLKLMAAPNVLYALAPMVEKKVAEHVMPAELRLAELEAMIGIEKILGAEVNPLLRLAVVMNDGKLTPKKLDGLVKRWKLSNKQKDYLLDVFRHKNDFDAKITLKTQKAMVRKIGKEIFCDVVKLYWAFHKDAAEFCTEAVRKALVWDVPVFPVSGRDLQSIGIAPGKEMGELLAKGEVWWEDGGYQAGKKEILEFLKS